MSLFVEVFDTEKKCQVIINLECVMEIAPLLSGGCEIAFPDAAAVSGKRIMKVSDSYALFKQLAMQMVSADDIAKINGRTSTKKEKAPIGDIMMDIPKL
jgi:hypothetical protein